MELFYLPSSPSHCKWLFPFGNLLSFRSVSRSPDFERVELGYLSAIMFVHLDGLHPDYDRINKDRSHPVHKLKSVLNKVINRDATRFHQVLNTKVCDQNMQYLRLRTDCQQSVHVEGTGRSIQEAIDNAYVNMFKIIYNDQCKRRTRPYLWDLARARAGLCK